MTHYDQQITDLMQEKKFLQAESFLEDVMETENFLVKYHHRQYIHCAIMRHDHQAVVQRYKAFQQYCSVQANEIDMRIIRAFVLSINEIDQRDYEFYFIFLTMKEFPKYLQELAIVHTKKFEENKYQLLHFTETYLQHNEMNVYVWLSIIILDVQRFATIKAFLDENLLDFSFLNICTVYEQLKKYLKNDVFFKLLSQRETYHFSADNIFTLCVLSSINKGQLSSDIVAKLITQLDNLKEECELTFDMKKASQMHLANKHSNTRCNSTALQVVEQQKKYKIALCISGQLRGYKETLRSYQKFFDRYKPDVYVSTWKLVGYKLPNLSHAHRVFSGSFLIAYKNVLHYLGMEQMQKKYPSLFTYLAHQQSINDNDLRSFYSTEKVDIEDDCFAPFSSYTNPEKMYYKMNRCHEMMKQSNIQYDIVIRLRPDKPLKIKNIDRFQEVFDSILKDENMIYVDQAQSLHPATEYVVGDQLAIGSMKAMNVYSSTWSTDKIHSLKKLPGTPMRPHNSIAYRLFLAGLEIEVLDNSFFEPLSNLELGAKIILPLLEQDTLGRMDDNDVELLRACKLDLKKRGINGNYIT